MPLSPEEEAEYNQLRSIQSGQQPGLPGAGHSGLTPAEQAEYDQLNAIHKRAFGGSDTPSTVAGTAKSAVRGLGIGASEAIGSYPSIIQQAAKGVNWLANDLTQDPNNRVSKGASTVAKEIAPITAPAMREYAENALPAAENSIAGNIAGNTGEVLGAQLGNKFNRRLMTPFPATYDRLAAAKRMGELGAHPSAAATSGSPIAARLENYTTPKQILTDKMNEIAKIDKKPGQSLVAAAEDRAKSIQAPSFMGIPLNTASKEQKQDLGEALAIKSVAKKSGGSTDTGFLDPDKVYAQASRYAPAGPLAQFTRDIQATHGNMPPPGTSKEHTLGGAALGLTAGALSPDLVHHYFPSMGDPAISAQLLGGAGLGAMAAKPIQSIVRTPVAQAYLGNQVWNTKAPPSQIPWLAPVNKKVGTFAGEFVDPRNVAAALGSMGLGSLSKDQVNPK